MPTITLPDDIAGGGANLVKAYTTTDNAVYVGLPPGVVIGVDVPDYPLSRLEGYDDKTSQWGLNTSPVNSCPIFLNRGGFRVSAAEQAAFVAFMWGSTTRQLSPAQFSPEWNLLYPFVPDDTALRRRFAPDADHYGYAVSVVFSSSGGVNAPSGDYIGYSVYPHWLYSAPGGSILATFAGWYHRKFAFTIAGGTTPPDPDPQTGCHCHYTRPAPPACTTSPGAPFHNTVYTRPGCGV